MAASPDPAVRESRLSLKIFELFFLFSLFLFPLFLGSVKLWALAFGAAFLLGAFAFYWGSRGSREGILKTELDRWILLFVLCFLVSLAFSKLRYLSWIELWKMLLVLTAFYATRYLCRDRLRIYHLAETFMFIGALLSAIGLLQFVGGFPKDWWSGEGFISSTYVNHNHFAGLLLLILPITFGLILAERSRSKKVLFIFLCALMGVAFVFSLSRGAVLALIPAMLFMMWALQRRHMISNVVLPFAVMLSLIVGAVIMFGTGPIEQRIETIQVLVNEEELSMKYRWLTWIGLPSMIGRFFWFGSGPGTFGTLFLQFRPEGGHVFRPVHAHNDGLQLLAECGIFAFLAFAALVFVFFSAGRRIVKRDSSRLRIGVGSGVLAGMIGLFFHSLFDFNFHIPANWLLSVVAAGLLFSMDEDQYYERGRIERAVRLSVPVLLAALFAGGLYWGLTDYGIEQTKELIRKKHPERALNAVQRVLSYNPFDAEAHYLRGFILAPKEPEKAVRDFDEAIRLNPYEPAYDLEKARAMAPQLIKSSAERLVMLLEKPIEKDPNNSAIGELVAREAFLHRGSGHPAFREAVGQMLAKRPETLSGLVTFLEKKGLWQFHRPYHLKLLGLDPEAAKKNAPADLWNRAPAKTLSLSDFTHSEQISPVQDEMFYRGAELTREIEVRRPNLRVVLKSKAEPAKNVYPVLYVKINGQIVDEHYVNSKVYKNYYTDLKIAPGTHRLSLHYANDLRVGDLKPEDRNLWIQHVQLYEYE